MPHRRPGRRTTRRLRRGGDPLTARALALLAALALPATAIAQPLDVSDPTPRDVRVELEDSSDLATVGASYGPPLPATWSASGNTGTLTIPIASHEAMRAGFLDPIPGSFTPIVIQIDLTSLEATSLSASGALENGPIQMSFVQAPLSTSAAAGFVTGPDVPFEVFCTSQAEVDQACLTVPAFCTAVCNLVPGAPYAPSTGQLNLVGSEEQQGCDGGVCSGPFTVFTPRGDLRLYEVPSAIPGLGAGTALLLALGLLALGLLATARARPRPAAPRH